MQHFARSTTEDPHKRTLGPRLVLPRLAGRRLPLNAKGYQGPVFVVGSTNGPVVLSPRKANREVQLSIRTLELGGE